MNKVRNELPIDKGWAWVICFAAFVCIVTAGVAMQTMAVLFLEIVAKFQTSVTTASIAVMLQVMCISFSSLFAVNIVVPKFGEKPLVVASGILVSLTSIGFSISPNIYVFILFSAIKGMGIGLIYVPSVSLIAKYFEKRRSLATTIANSGISVALIAVPPAIRAILTEYGFSGTYLIVAGIELHMVAAGLLMRPVSSYQNVMKPFTEKEMEYNTEAGEKLLTEQNNISQDPIETKLNMEKTTSGKNVNNLNSKSKTSVIDKNSKYTSCQMTNRAEKFGTSPVKSFGKTDNYLESIPENVTGNGLSFYEKQDEENKFFKRSDSRFSESSDYDNTIDLQVFDNQETENDGVLENVKNGKPTYDRVLSVEKSKKGHVERRISVISFMSGVETGVVERPKLQDKEHGEDYTDRCDNCFTRFLGKLFDLHLFKYWSFRVWCMSVVTSSVNQYLLQYIPTIAVSQGATKDQGALLLAITGAVDLASRFIIGFVADLHVITASWLVAMGQFGLGLICQFGPLFTTFETQIAFAVIMGLFIGTRQSLLPMAIIDVVGVEKLPNAFSITAMIATISAACHNPMLSAVMESTGSFNVVLHYCGAALFMTAFIIVLRPLTERFNYKNIRD